MLLIYHTIHDLSRTHDQIYMDTNISLKSIVGIQNVGNSCYCNTVLQLLKASPELSILCADNDFSGLKQNKYKPILLAYQDILKALWSAYKPAYIRPLGFISEIRKSVKDTVYEMFGYPIPNDSHEFLVYLLDNFHEALKEESPYVEKDGTDISILAENNWNTFLSKNNSDIFKLFFGMMKKTIQCTNCSNRTYQWEMFNVLKISCEGDTFKEWIRNECKESEIEGYQCDKCNGRYTAKMYNHLWKLPHTLFISMKRFTPTGQKIMKPCPYNGEVITFTEFFAEESSDSSKARGYELRGVSDHHGSHMGGHYTAQIKHPISGEWWYMDDEASHRLESPKFGGHNYIFLFRSI